MAPRYLFGPVTPAFAEQHLARARAAGDCLTFNAAGTADLTIRPGDRWEDIERFLPGDWRPAFIVLYLPYTTIPAGLWAAPCPLVGLAADWNLCWSTYRHCLKRCEIVLTDTVGVETLAREGISQARAANLYGLERGFHDHAWPEQERDIDILFVGNLHPAVQRERLAWLGRLARLGDRWRVTLATGVFGDAYRSLLARARVVFNRGIRGECNKRVFETAASGALLFQEAGNRETGHYLRDRQECVLYTENDLETLLDHYLRHEDERQTLAEAARTRCRDFGFATLWEQTLRAIEPALGRAVSLAQERATRQPRPGLTERVQQLLASSEPGDPSHWPATWRRRWSRRRSRPRCTRPSGLVASRGGNDKPAPAALGYFRRAVAAEPLHPLAGLNLTEALVGCGQTKEAIEQARKTLALLECTTTAAAVPSWLDEGHFPAAYDLFRVEWELRRLAARRRPGRRSRLQDRAVALAAACAAGRPHQRVGPFPRGCCRSSRPAGHAARRWAVPWPAPAGSTMPRRICAGPSRPIPSICPRPVPCSASWGRPAIPSASAAWPATAACCTRPPRRWCRPSPGCRTLLHSATNWPPLSSSVTISSTIRACVWKASYATPAPPYELILVDNASTDGTAAYLEEVCRRPGPVCVRVQRNAINRGFPAGCNQGLTLGARPLCRLPE